MLDDAQYSVWKVRYSDYKRLVNHYTDNAMAMALVIK